jgi:hypothetical protein
MYSQDCPALSCLNATHKCSPTYISCVLLANTGVRFQLQAKENLRHKRLGKSTAQQVTKYVGFVPMCKELNELVEF